jgi:hypothetical protein
MLLLSIDYLEDKAALSSRIIIDKADEVQVVMLEKFE